ncbi:MAG: hypothetical protein M3Z01_09675 [Thermoproteota archaeon]|nr:hypothetical protein [Thermoproteota archaeon]
MGSILLGIICSLFINRTLIIKKENESNLSNNIKSEINNLLFEKSMALEALNKIKQYFDEEKIDVYEKDRLLLKYGKLLDHYDARIHKLQPIFEAQEIYEYREQLYSLISDSIAKLDEKLSNFSNNFNYLQKNDANINKKDSKHKPGLYSIPMNQKITPPTSKSGIMKSDMDSLIPVDKSEKNDLIDTTGENSMTFPSIVENTDVEHDKNNDGDKEINNISGTKKDDLGDFNIDEINKIQKDVLNILQRLENPSAKI